ncbi:MAG: hypothetical protein KDA91_21260 [Planctomycetaceae bacterium]|nr:hypothetical protein [Planctomycetaceae bacterium]
MSDTPDDSGHRSIAGYFYQSVLTSALPVELLETLHRDGATDSIELMSIVYPEEHGQDAVVIAGAGTKVVAKVVQHKFSSWPDKNTNEISPAELFDILEKLDKSAQHVKERHKVEPRICLHTNRRLSLHSKKYLDASRNDEPNDALDKTVQQLDKDGKVTANAGRSLEKNKLYRECLKKLEYDPKHVGDAKATLERRAHTFGVTTTEVNERMKRIEGEVYGIMTNAALRKISLADLDRWLTGDDAPSPIASKRTDEIMRGELNDAGQFLDRFHPLVTRGQQTELAAALNSSIILVVGEGGLGKSTLVFQYLTSVLQIPPTQYVSARHVTDTSSVWCGHVFCRWRNSQNHNLRNCDPEGVLKRLELATPTGKSPLLLLWLDGIDESGAERFDDVLRELRPLLREEQNRINATAAAPRIQLILTCRRADDFEVPYGIEDQFGNGNYRVPVIEMQQFNRSDISNLPDGFLPPTVVKRFCEGLEDSNNKTWDNGQRIDALTESDIEPFCHPPLMAALRQVDEKTAHGCLDKDSASMRKVAKLYLKWFALKVCRRRRARAKEEVFQQLSVIADACGNNGPFSYYDHWESPAIKFGFLQLQAHDLYKEALSAGLILKHGTQKWHWRNCYVTLGIEESVKQEGVSP